MARELTPFGCRVSELPADRTKGTQEEKMRKIWVNFAEAEKPFRYPATQARLERAIRIECALS
jgi:hypothetical protein